MTVDDVRAQAARARKFTPRLREQEAHFAIVPFVDLAETEPPALAYWWNQYMPAGVVTLLGGHGGAGKSIVSLMLAVCIAIGRPLFGVPTRRGIVVFFSGEDGGELLRYRLRWICQGLGVPLAELDGRLHILDATDADPVLFQELVVKGQRSGSTTPAYGALVEYFERVGADVLMVDNASDVFDGSEISRAMVRAFMRSLVRIARARAGAVLLLAHVDKSTARGLAGGTDSYSGSTAWHNSARSRLFLSRDGDGALKLEHQKHNLGRMREPLPLVWPDGGLPQALDPVGPLSQRIIDAGDMRALLGLIHEFYGRGEFVHPMPNATTNAVRMLRGERALPKRKPGELFGLLRDAERRGLIEREAYQTDQRKPRERWRLTAAGTDFVRSA